MLKEAEAADLVLEQDPIGAVLQQRAAAGKLWQEQARTLMAGLKVCTTCPLWLPMLVHTVSLVKL